MRRRLTTVVVAAGLLVAPGGASAQDDGPRQVCITVTGAPADVTAGALLAGLLNGSITLDAVSAQCDAPTTPPVVGPGDYGSDLPGVGATQSHRGVDITLVEVDWDVEPGQFGGPDPGKRLVSILVLYVATEDGGNYNPFNWSAVDLDGFQWDRSFFGGREPALQSSSDLPAGRRAQGWVTFEVPEDLRALEIVETQGLSDHVRWLISR